MRGTWKTTDSGGSGLVLAAIAAAVLIGSGAASAAVSALEVIAIVIACLAVAAVAGGIALLVYRARSEPRRRVIPAPVIRQVGPAAAPELSEPYKPAIEPAREYHLHIHGVSADELAAIINRIGHEE